MNISVILRKWKRILPWNAKADTGSNLIMWFGTVIVVIIVVSWLITNVLPYYQVQENIDHDSKNLYLLFSDACNADRFKRLYNPIIETGVFVINNSYFCLESYELSRCYYLLCDTNYTNKVNLDNITYLNITYINTYQVSGK